MKNGQCSNCGSTDIYVSQAGGGVGSGFQIYFRNGETMKPIRDWETHLCASCGYFENFILNRDLLDNIVNNPQGNGWKKAG